MKSRKNPVNALTEKGEESAKLSALDDLPYDFSKTDKIHRVSDLLRFLGIDEKREDDGGLTVLFFWSPNGSSWDNSKLIVRLSHYQVRKSVDDPTQVGCHTEMRTIDLAGKDMSNNQFIIISVVNNLKFKF